MIKLLAIDNTSSISERETFLLRSNGLEQTNGVFIRTCNRIEFYYGDGEIPVMIARHLFNVVSGLRSGMLGEIAIQGQVKSAYMNAAEKFRLSCSLHKLFQTALYVGKRVRVETGISKGAMTHSNAAVDIICKSGIDLSRAIITIIGVNKLNENIIRFLRARKAETILLGNKSFDKAQHLASAYGCKAFTLERLKEFLEQTDVLISATSAPHLIVKADIFPAGKKMLIIDLAFPRDIDERIGFMDNVSLYNLENIEKFVDQNVERRRNELKKAEQIIEEEIERILIKQKSYVAVDSKY